MKNSANIHTDGINVYVTSQVRSHPAGKWIVTLFTVLVGCLLLFIFAKIDPVKHGAAIIPLFLVSFLFYYFIVRYTLWNWFGKEHLIINTKSVSTQLDYGWYRTNLKTMNFSRLGLSSEIIQKTDEQSFGKIYFFNYREEDNLPEEIYQTAILLPEQQLEEIKDLIWLLFEPVTPTLNQFPYSLN